MKRTLLVALVAVAAVAAASFAYAAIPSANGTISACKDSKGALKVIDADAGQTCNGNQQLLAWNQQGPQGPAGPAGTTDAYLEIVADKSIPGVGTASTIGTLSLSAGQYLVFAKGNILSGGVQTSVQNCTLTGPQDDDSVVVYEHSSAPYVEAFSLVIPATYATNGSATLSCQSWGGATLSEVRISAIKVGNLTTS